MESKRQGRRYGRNLASHFTVVRSGAGIVVSPIRHCGPWTRWNSL